MNDLILQLIYALFATCGLSIHFKLPAKQIPYCMMTGALSWGCYQFSIYYEMSPVMSCFLASCFVGVLSEIFARFRKEASTVFTIPGIICLVPGSNIYYTMAAILEQNFNQAASVGTETLMMAGAIAAGLLIVGSLIRILRSVIRRTVNLKEKL